MDQGNFWYNQIGQLSEEYLKMNFAGERPIRFQGLQKAYRILEKENRKEDMIEFVALVSACILAKDMPEMRSKNEDVLDRRFRDLLERAITPSCAECGTN